MKKLLLGGILTLLVGILMVSCKKEGITVPSENEILKEKLLGKWNWQEMETVVIYNNGSYNITTAYIYWRGDYWDFKTDGTIVWADITGTYTGIPDFYNYTFEIIDSNSFIQKSLFIQESAVRKISKLDDHNLIFYSEENNVDNKTTITFKFTR